MRSVGPTMHEDGQRFDAVARSLADAVLVMDANGEILFANEEVRPIFGYRASELVGENVTLLFGGRNAPDDAPLPGRTGPVPPGGAPGETLDRFETRGLRRDGTRVLLHVTYGSYEQGGQRFYTGIFRDLSERERTESRMRFQARLLDAVGEAVIATDPVGRILYWNTSAERLYGWSSDEVVGRPVDEVTPAEVARAHAIAIMERLQEGESWTGEFMVRDRQGRTFPVLVTDSPVLDDDGSLMGIIGTSKEITERKRTEDSQRFLAEAGRVLASSLDYQTTLSRVSRLAVPILGSWCMVHLLDPRHRPEPVAHCAPDGRDDDVPTLEAVLARRGGVLDRVLPATDPVHIPAGDPLLGDEGTERLRRIGIGEILVVPLAIRAEPLGVMVFGRAESQRSYDEADLRLAGELALRAASAIDNARLYREAEESDRAKTDFLAVVSHELRTPLNAITGYAELLTGGISGELNEKQKGQIERIRVSARHLAQLIDEILTYARMEGGRDEVDTSLTDVSEIVREAVSVLEPEARSRGLALRVEAPEDGPELRTDPGKLRQVVVNLVSNAVKYTEEGRIDVRVKVGPSRVFLDVEDTGIGIPAEEQERIFEPFRQVQSPNTRTVGGTGLGLSVSRRLVRLLGGEITVRSRPGHGSTFTVALPLGEDDRSGE